MSRVYTRNDGVLCQYIVGRVCSNILYSWYLKVVRSIGIYEDENGLFGLLLLLLR